MLIALIKTPIKTFLIRRGLKDSSKASAIFKAIVTFASFVLCFIGAIIYFKFYLNVNPFADLKILAYTIGVLGASQVIYQIYEVYGRDGLFVIIKNAILNKRTTALAEIDANTSTLSQRINEMIKEKFENAPDVSEVVKTVLDQVLLKPPKT